MNLTQFAGDGSTTADTVLVAPSATVRFIDKNLAVSGDESMRLIRDDIDASGENWRYDQDAKKLWIGKNVRVVFKNTQLDDLIK